MLLVSLWSRLVPSGPLSLVLHFNHAVINTSKLPKNRSRLSTFSMLSTSAPVPRPSASLIVVNAHNEVLLVHRNPKARAFGGMTVCHIKSFLASKAGRPTLSSQGVPRRKLRSKAGFLVSNNRDQRDFRRIWSLICFFR